MVELGDRIDVRLNNRVRALTLAIEQAALPGVLEVVPTYRSLAIAYDPLEVEAERLTARIAETLRHLREIRLPPPKVVRIPTVYGGAYGPDLPFVARHNGLTEEEVIRIHSRTRYHVYMIGFAAGFAYLGGLSRRIATPRLESPRLRVPVGSVGIGGIQTGVYPAETPGGWRIIGRTYVKLFDPLREPPTPMDPGDKVQFIPISEAEYLGAVSQQPSAPGGTPELAAGR